MAQQKILEPCMKLKLTSNYTHESSRAVDVFETLK